MKIGIVPSSLLKHANLTARHFLGATTLQVAKQMAVVAADKKRVAASERKLADINKSFNEGAIPGVKIVKEDTH